jgi:integrase
MGGKLHLFKRPRSSYWQCWTYLAGKKRRMSTKEERLARAKEVAEDWYLELRGKQRAGEIKSGKTFRTVTDQFMKEYRTITQGQRNAQYVDGHQRRITLHLVPYFGDMLLSDINAATVQEYRVHRTTSRINEKTGEPLRPARGTIHQEIVVLRQILKMAERNKWISAVPNLSPAYKSSGKITHRAWFSQAEYRQLYEATRSRANAPKSKRWKWASEQLHDYVLFMANTGLRPDEAGRLEYRDVTFIKENEELILLIEVRGKRGVGYCKSTVGAVRPYQRLKKRNNPQPQDRLFPGDHREMFNAILNELGLKIDRDGNRRTAYSLRHSYICFRLMEGADIYQIAKNCRTSVEMIEKHYAAHIRTTLDAAAINVRRNKPTPGAGRAA